MQTQHDLNHYMEVVFLANTLNIYQRLAKIRNSVDILQKDKSGYGYNYLSSEEILPRVKGLMQKYNVSLIPRIVPGSTNVVQYHFTETKTAKNGDVFEKHNNEILIDGEMEYVWVCDDNPEDNIVVPWKLVGQQTDASQAFGSGLSYSMRYFLIDYFNIATTNDDPEELQKRRMEAAEQEMRETAKAIISRVHELVTTHLQDHADDKQALIDIIKKFAKEKGKASANYNAITDPETAAGLLKAIAEFMKIEV